MYCQRASLCAPLCVCALMRLRPHNMLAVSTVRSQPVCGLGLSLSLSVSFSDSLNLSWPVLWPLYLVTWSLNRLLSTKADSRCSPSCVSRSPPLPKLLNTIAASSSSSTSSSSASPSSLLPLSSSSCSCCWLLLMQHCVSCGRVLLLSWGLARCNCELH